MNEPYTLTLTKGERDAIDWVGNRYSHGDDLYRLLCECHAIPDDVEWDDNTDITYVAPMHIGALIIEAIEDDSLTCFDTELCRKLYAFRDSVV